MENTKITLVMKDYDYIAPLACGDITVQGLELNLDRQTSMIVGRDDPDVSAVELSFSAYLIRLSQGNRGFMGIPFFAYRAFRHRCFYVLKDSGLDQLQNLKGKRVGTNAWPDSGNTWTRAALREQGVAIGDVQWWVGPIDDPSYDSHGHRPEITLPPNVTSSIPVGSTLLQMLLEGELDALMCPWPPKGFYQPESRIKRLIPDYRQAEQAYYGRTGIYPGQHIIGLRRAVFESNPMIAKDLYQALDESMRTWMERRRMLAETSPWLLADIEEAVDLIGYDWQPNGVGPNLHMIKTMCDEEYAQGLISTPLDATQVFSEFESVMERG
jgi:4,5-dihydroxyphthalate decarboxylase